MNGWSLPQRAEIGGREYEIHSDFRDILEIIDYLNDAEQDQQVRVYVALSLFYDGFEAMPPVDYEAALQWLFDFIDCGDSAENAPRRPKTIDWQQDMPLIVSDINRVAGTEVRALAYCHWWTFIAWFNAIGEGQLSTVVSIREKRRRGKKLESWERDFYRENRHKIDFRSTLTQSETDLLDQWTKGVK